MSRRQYPVLRVGGARPTRPLSFVVVRYSDACFHNILQSECVHDSLNQLITIDNRNNLFFDNLSQAINAGIDRAEHDIIVAVHEDVFLPQGWQEQFEQSLALLEERDRRWGVLGSVGWKADGTLVGHWSDPRTYRNTLVDTTMLAVARLDEQLLIIRRSSGLRLDEYLPTIHNLGIDVPCMARERGMKTYVIEAPTIHKYADEHGKRIEAAEDSSKFKERKQYTYLADKACSDQYVVRKWPGEKPNNYDGAFWKSHGIHESVRQQLEEPLVLLARGGSGSRLLSLLAEDADVFLGVRLNGAGDSVEMVIALYVGALTKYQHRVRWQKEGIVSTIRRSAARMLERGRPSGSWGFKLPESMFLVPEIHQAFGKARFVHLIRDPLTTCLRRTHMTARFDNTIGRMAIPLAYRYCGQDPVQSLKDSPAVRMAYTTIHQIETVRDYAACHLGDQYLEIRFEKILSNPTEVLSAVTEWLGTEHRGDKLQIGVDPVRAAEPDARYTYPRHVEEKVASILAPLRVTLGYLPAGCTHHDSALSS